MKALGIQPALRGSAESSQASAHFNPATKQGNNENSSERFTGAGNVASTLVAIDTDRRCLTQKRVTLKVRKECGEAQTSRATCIAELLRRSL
jgi:hypothetical protein